MSDIYRKQKSLSNHFSNFSEEKVAEKFTASILKRFTGEIKIMNQAMKFLVVFFGFICAAKAEPCVDNMDCNERGYLCKDGECVVSLIFYCFLISQIKKEIIEIS